jgi:hypothetical protein
VSAEATVRSLMAYEPDNGDLRTVSRNVARWIITNYVMFAGNFVTLRFVQKSLRGEMPTSHSLYSDLTRVGVVVSGQYMCLRPERVRVPGEPYGHSALFFDDALLERCRAWLQHSSDAHPVIVDIDS